MYESCIYFKYFTKFVVGFDLFKTYFSLKIKIYRQKTYKGFSVSGLGVSTDKQGFDFKRQMLIPLLLIIIIRGRS